MADHPLPPIAAADRAVLRELGRRHREAAESPRNRECVRLWRAHDAGDAGRPLLLTETGGDLNRLVQPDYRLETEHPWARYAEEQLKTDLIHFDLIGDDHPLEPCMNVRWTIEAGGWGVDFVSHRPAESHGARQIASALPAFPEGLEQVHVRDFAVDRADTLARQAALEEVFDGVMPVRMRGGSNTWSYGLTKWAIQFIGLETLMLAIYDCPDALHRLVGIIRDDRQKFLDWQEAENLLTLNNENDYIGSGSRGYTARLPADPAVARGEQPARVKDLWGLLESQETVLISPEQYAEFVFPYEEALARRFGSTYYGCCEPIHSRWETVRRLPGLARASVSPWCDEAFCAEAFGKAIVYSRKPNPTLVSTGRFDPDLIRADLRQTLELTRRHGCRTEIIMKDVHTLSGEPDRLRRWVDLGRDLISEL